MSSRGVSIAAFALGLTVATTALPQGKVDAGAAPPIAAAAVLKFPLTEIANHFSQDTGHQVQITYEYAAVLVSQIENGAPFQMFLSTRESFFQQLAREGIARDSGVVYAVGRVVLFAPSGSSLRAGKRRIVVLPIL